MFTHADFIYYFIFKYIINMKILFVLIQLFTILKSLNRNLAAAATTFITPAPKISATTTNLKTYLTIDSLIMESLLGCIDPKINTTTGGFQIRKLLRLAFHDCNGKRCDASINFNNPDNNGLADIVTKLYTQYTKVGTCGNLYRLYLSRPDFFTLCQIRAFAWGLKKGLNNRIPYLANRSDLYTFSYGKSDNGLQYNNDDYEGVFPNGTANWASGPYTSVMDGLGPNGLGLAQKHIVALVGLHITGSASSNRSGFQGPWGIDQVDTNRITNRLYLMLEGKIFSNFTQKLAPSNNTSTIPPKYQWNALKQPQILLNVDMAMHLKFVTNTTGQTTTPYCSSNCPNTSIANNQNLVKLYATNNIQYILDLTQAFIKLTSFTDANSTIKSYKATYNVTAKRCQGDLFLTQCNK